MKCAYQADLLGEVVSSRVEESPYVTDSGHFLV
jgi:hypothetical protein